MLYLIKFVYQWLLPPACIFLFFVGMNVYLHRRKVCGRWLMSFVLAVFYLLSIRVGADLLVRPLESWYPQPGAVQGDVLLMLGNGSLAGVPDITDPGQPSGTMAKSMLMTFRLQRMTGLPILVSGGQVFQDTGTEAEIAGREFREMGVAEQELFLEDRSRNTVENARFSKEVCSAQGWQRPVLLVVALQAPRTAMIFAREGMDCLVYPTHYRCAAQWHFSPVQDLVPSADCLSDSAAALREYLGIAALKLKLQ